MLWIQLEGCFMEIEMIFMTEKWNEKYDNFLYLSENALFYHSEKYIRLLEKILLDCEFKRILAISNNEILASMAFVVKKSELGNVVNSLPFFGSHGSVVSLEGTPKFVKKMVFDKFYDFCVKEEVLSSTIIENISTDDREILESFPYTFKEVRFGNITKLVQNKSVYSGRDLLLTFDGKTRNAISKSRKSGFKFAIEDGDEVIDEIANLHYENMRAKNGISKPQEFFFWIKKIFEPGKDYRIYTARTSNGILAAGALLFYFKNYVEYFVPVIDINFRNLQPLSGLIFEAMVDATEQGKYTYWNWGGSWLSQEDLRKFKSKWGASEFTYQYYVRLYSRGDVLLGTKKETIQNQFPFFFTVPFSELE